jgi:hypothetical protein
VDCCLLHGAIADTKPTDMKMCETEYAGSSMSASMRSYAVVKASPNESKFMHVELSANDGILCISMLQNQDRVLRTFTLVKLVIKNIIVCWESTTNDVFVVCMKVGGKIEGDIWCYTSALLRNKWLVMLKNNGARMATMKQQVKGMRNIDNYVHMTLQKGQANSPGRNAKSEGDYVIVERETDLFIVYDCVLLICAVVAEMWMQGFYSHE